MFKKSKAFTLAEILITIGILGLVSAILLPQINTNVSKTQYVTALKSISANMTDKIQAQMALEDVDDFGYLKAVQMSPTKTEFIQNISSFLSLKPAPEAHKGLVWLNGESATTYPDNFRDVWEKEHLRMTKSGALLYIHGYSQPGQPTQDNGIGITIEEKVASGIQLYMRYAVICLDVNGYKKPNRVGRDIFKFYIGQNGALFPLGGIDTSTFFGSSGEDYDDPSKKHNCFVESTGLGCAGRIRAENWKMNY